MNALDTHFTARQQGFALVTVLWAIALLAIGVALMYLAVNYPALRVRLAARWQRAFR